MHMGFGDGALQAWLKEIGRGRDGARSLSADDAQALFSAVFSGALGDLETGAVLIALRMKGESVEEVAGAMAALAPHVRPVPVDVARPVVVIPTYNGARHMANLVPLLACLLADAGLQVVVHGVREDPRRTTTREILQAMGLGDAIAPADPRGVLARQVPVFVPVDLLCPPLARLLELRWRLGVRNIGHTLCKLLEPTGAPGALQLASFTHPEFNLLQHAWFERIGTRAVIARGTEGEVVANARRAVQVDWVHDGRTEVLAAGESAAVAPLPALPEARDAQATARWIQSVLAGERPVPPAIDAQVRRIVGLCARPAASLDGVVA